jgi:hypothetical protein
MTDTTFATIEIGSAIGQAVAPVFLLTAIGGILNVMAHRLSRVVDRARHLETNLGSWQDDQRQTAVADLAILSRRMTAANRAIALCTLSALLVCMVVALLFVEQLTSVQADAAIAWLFISATLALTIGLMLFLWEVQMALRSVRVRARGLMQDQG